MHPNPFLKTLWRNEILDQVFVAMSFERRFLDRFENIFRPAIEAEPILGRKLTAFRVDNSKTGDSILSEIIDGIAHSRFFIADISEIDVGKNTGATIRNGNVMYEIGMALACRNPSECLLLKDDNKPSLFDISTIPFLTMDFTDTPSAISHLHRQVTERIAETDRIKDARVSMAAQAITEDEFHILSVLSKLAPDESRHLSVAFDEDNYIVSLPTARGLDRLISKGCLVSTGIHKTYGIYYKLNEIGWALAVVSG